MSEYVLRLIWRLFFHLNGKHWDKTYVNPNRRGKIAQWCMAKAWYLEELHAGRIPHQERAK